MTRARTLFGGVAAVLLLGAALLAGPRVAGGEVGAAEEAAPETRTFAFTYAAMIAPPATRGAPVDVFVPLARESARQQILSEETDASVEGAVATEAAYGNRFWRAGGAGGRSADYRAPALRRGAAHAAG